MEIIESFFLYKQKPTIVLTAKTKPMSKKMQLTDVSKYVIFLLKPSNQSLCVLYIHSHFISILVFELFPLFSLFLSPYSISLARNSVKFFSSQVNEKFINVMIQFYYYYWFSLSKYNFNEWELIKRIPFPATVLWLLRKITTVLKNSTVLNGIWWYLFARAYFLCTHARTRPL